MVVEVDVAGAHADTDDSPAASDSISQGAAVGRMAERVASYMDATADSFAWVEWDVRM